MEDLTYVSQQSTVLRGHLPVTNHRTGFKKLFTSILFDYELDYPTPITTALVFMTYLGGCPVQGEPE